jgi:uncharacterized small protein (DUF1192 family)
MHIRAPETALRSGREIEDLFHSILASSYIYRPHTHALRAAPPVRFGRAVSPCKKHSDATAPNSKTKPGLQREVGALDLASFFTPVLPVNWMVRERTRDNRRYMLSLMPAPEGAEADNEQWEVMEQHDAEPDIPKLIAALLKEQARQTARRDKKKAARRAVQAIQALAQKRPKKNLQQNSGQDDSGQQQSSPLRQPLLPLLVGLVLVVVLVQLLVFWP